MHCARLSLQFLARYANSNRHLNLHIRPETSDPLSPDQASQAESPCNCSHHLGSPSGARLAPPVALSYGRGSSDSSEQRGNLEGQRREATRRGAEVLGWDLTPSRTSPVTSGEAADFHGLPLQWGAARENARGQRERLGPKVSGGRGAAVGGPGRFLPAAVEALRGPGSPPPAVQPSPSRWPRAERRSRPHTHLGQGPEGLRKPLPTTADSERSLCAQTPRGACREGGRSDGALGQSACLTAPAHHSAPSGSAGWRPTARALREGTWRGFVT